MSFKTKITGAALALSLSAGAQAGIQEWDFKTPPNFNYAGDGNHWQITQDGITLTVTGWSDTWDTSPDEVRDAELIWANSEGLGIANQDEGTGFPSGNNHGIDSFGEDGGAETGGDHDMVLLTFSEAVNLEGIDINWARNGTATNNADVSILAWDGIGSDVLDGKTWAQVLDSNGGGYTSTDNANIGLNYYGVNAGEVTSTKWLVGVYNPVFGTGLSGGNDAIKLDLIRTSTDDDPTGDVPVPGSLGLVLLGLAGLRKRWARS